MIKVFENNENPDLNLIFDEINEEHFNNKITKIPCSWNTKMRVTAGRIKYSRKNTQWFVCLTPKSICLSLPLFKNNDMDMSKIIRTMQHEMTHAYLLEHHAESGHTKRFQSIMTRITGEDINHRCHSYDVTGLRNNTTNNIRYACECGQTVGYRKRMPKKGLVYTARCCGGIVTFSRLNHHPDYNL